MASIQPGGINSEDVLLHIFSFLPIPDLARCAAVCERWHDIVTASTHLWKGKRYTSRRSPRKCAETRAVLLALPPLERVDVELGYICCINFSYPCLSLSMTDISDLGSVEDWQKLRCTYLSTNLNSAESLFSPHLPIDFAELRKVAITNLSRFQNHIRPGTRAESAIASALQLCPNLRELGVCVESLSADCLDTLEAMSCLRTLKIESTHLEKLVFLRHCSEMLEELEFEWSRSVPSPAFEELRHLGNLRRLRMHHCKIEKGDLEVAALGLRSLVSLQLCSCNISDLSFLRHCEQLRELHVSTDPLLQWGTQLRGLGRLPTGIRSLHLSNETVTADKLSEALPRLPLLEELTLCAKLGHLGILRGCPQLRRLCLETWMWPAPLELSGLRHLSRLDTLDLKGHNFDVATLCAVVPSLLQLDTLSLGYQRNVIHLLRDCPRLHSLSLLDKYGKLCDTNKLWKYNCGTYNYKFVCKFVRVVVCPE